jgi:hypothetical protein
LKYQRDRKNPLEKSTLKPEIKHFLMGHFTSVAQLEMLLLMQVDPTRRWTTEEIARELRTNFRGTQRELTALGEHGLVRLEHGDRHTYAPTTEELHALVVAVAQAYIVSPMTVLQVIYSKTQDTPRDPDGTIPTR